MKEKERERKEQEEEEEEGRKMREQKGLQEISKTALQSVGFGVQQSRLAS